MNAFAHPLFRNLLSGLSSISRKTWILIAAFLLLLMGLLAWAAISIAGWLFGMAQQGVDAAPETVRSISSQVEQFMPGAQETVRSATAQVEQIIPGAQETLGALLPALSANTLPTSDVSGTDPGPVARFPGLVRVQWLRTDQHVQVRYQGQAALPEVIGHYAGGFAAQGYQQNLLSATTTEERHEYVKDGARFGLIVSIQNRNQITVDLVAPAS
ncbi:hypothetical protein [Azoarcus taiwanensis]|uniref:Uncharacterized protein n=1 Tax=Azoarcus taiwanensis TaxID=666964 RepID=A0A972FGK1_9RHOO|nr:hypothetical protein [Azoarcus taiwanensis]NMG04952.1 hypothetical protein [Azoarcus taiwanensis]